jgi:hypothetical protein
MWLARENEFARLDHDAWESLKSEAFQYLPNTPPKAALGSSELQYSIKRAPTITSLTAAVLWFASLQG